MAKPIAHDNEFDAFARLAGQSRDIERLKRRSSGKWHYVGTAGEAIFKNSWVNQGGTLSRLRWRWSLAGGPDIEGSVTGGAAGTVVITLPLYIVADLDGEIRISGSDDAGAHIVWRIKPNGDVLIGL